MVMPLDFPFATDYLDARAQFLEALDAFERQAGVLFSRQRFTVDRSLDLTIDCAELRAKSPERLYVAVSGVHGIEGFAGNAIQRVLLARTLPRFDLSNTSLLFVHAVNPYGMHHLRRVNAANVDLNRNFTEDDGALYTTDSRGYMLIAPTLGPEHAYHGGALARPRFFAALLGAVAGHGYGALRQATLAGQYVAPRGIFFGGRERQPETRFFQQVFEAASARVQAVLLTDLHTGYGIRGQASALFGRADTPAFREFVDEGVRDRSGKDQRYDANGDLVGWCQAAHKRVRPDGSFDGVVIELGTTGLSPATQLADLHAVVRENQVHHYGARDPATAERVALRFRGLFDPRDRAWQRKALGSAIDTLERLLGRCGYL
jgi:hypothetical protein